MHFTYWNNCSTRPSQVLPFCHYPRKSRVLGWPENSCRRVALHPVGHRAGIAALEIAVARHRPQREKLRIAVVAQIEHARKTGRGIARLVPEAVGALRVGEILEAARDRGMIDFAGGHQAEQRPGRL